MHAVNFAANARVGILWRGRLNANNLSYMHVVNFAKTRRFVVRIFLGVTTVDRAYTRVIFFFNFSHHTSNAIPSSGRISSLEESASY